CGEGLGVGVLQRITALPPPRRHSASKTRVNALKAPTLPTRGRVDEFAAGADFNQAAVLLITPPVDRTGPGRRCRRRGPRPRSFPSRRSCPTAARRARPRRPAPPPV